MHNSTETEIKRVVLDILGHSKPNTCERCRHYDECYKDVLKESSHISICLFCAWDKDLEMEKLSNAIKLDN